MRVVASSPQAGGGRRMTILGMGGTSKQPPPIPSGSSPPVAQVLPGCLYFTSVPTGAPQPRSDARTLYVPIADQEPVHYDAFYDDFGPLNLAVLYRFCQFLNDLIQKSARHTSSRKPPPRIFLYTDMDPQNRVNAVYLIASYMIIYHNLTAEQAYLRLQAAEPPPFIGFRDAALGAPSYLLHVQHVIKAIEKAVKFGWLDFAHFDPDEYEYFERVENGDLNWIVPGKLLSFCGPHDRSYIENGYPYHSPEVYFDYFRTHNVTTIVRLNKKIYDAKRFTDAGFAHHDLFFIDGSTPNDDIVLRFIDIVEQAPGAVAVHCKAGLGRTGCMIACWMMKNFRLTAPQCMGWLRVCRPGSVIGPQQQFLIDKQAWCWRLGSAEGLKNTAAEEEEAGGKQPQAQPVANGTTTTTRRRSSTRGEQQQKQMNGDVGGSKAAARKAMEEETSLNAEGQSQGDRLCERKARHQHQRSATLRTSTSPRTPESGGANVLNPPQSSTPFVFPLPEEEDGSKTGQDNNMAMDMDTMNNKDTTTPKITAKAGTAKTTKIATIYSSATTPIKQLKLSTTMGVQQQAGIGVGGPGHPPAFVTNLNNNTNALSNAGSSSSRNPHHRVGTNRIPIIHKVSVTTSSSALPSATLTPQQQPTSSRVHPLHRKHFSASRLKPYHPTTTITMAEASSSSSPYSHNNHRYLELAGLAGPSHSSNFSPAAKCYTKALAKQYTAISAERQQRQDAWTSPSSTEPNNNNPNNNCKYELRPRDQLHLPLRFTSEAPSPATPSGSSSPFALTRHQKTSKSATAFFPPSRL